MKVTHIITYLFLLVGTFLLSACQDDDPLEPHGVKITFQAVTGLKGSADALRIEEAMMGIGAIDLKREGEADSALAEKIVYEGPYVVNLLNGTTSPAIRWIFAEPGDYKKIDVSTYRTLPQGNTIILKGYISPADAGEEIPFEFITSRIHTLEIENNTGITIREGEELDLMVVFDLSDLFSDINLEKLNKNEQGVVVISDDESVGSVISVINTFEAFSSFGINEGLPFPGTENETPDNEVPGEVDNPDDEDQDDSSEDGKDDNADEEPGDGANDDTDDSSSGDDSGDSDNNGDGSTDGDEDNGADNGGTPGSDSGETPSNDDDENQEEDEEENSGNDNDDEESDSDSGTNEDDGEEEGDGDVEDSDDEEDEEDDDKGKGDQSDKNKDKGKGNGGKGKGK